MTAQRWTFAQKGVLIPCFFDFTSIPFHTSYLVLHCKEIQFLIFLAKWLRSYLWEKLAEKLLVDRRKRPARICLSLLWVAAPTGLASSPWFCLPLDNPLFVGPSSYWVDLLRLQLPWSFGNNSSFLHLPHPPSGSGLLPWLILELPYLSWPLFHLFPMQSPLPETHLTLSILFLVSKIWSPAFHTFWAIIQASLWFPSSFLKRTWGPDPLGVLGNGSWGGW